MARLCMMLGLLTTACVAGVLISSPAAADKPESKIDDTLVLAKAIDIQIERVWERDKLSPAGKSSDAEFLRRVYLDVVGEPPTRAEAEAFLASKARDKRHRLINTLLGDPRFGEHLADRWMPVFRERGTDELGELSVSANDILASWLAEQFNAGAGFDAIARAMITVDGPISANPAAAYYGLAGFPVRTADAAGVTSKHFSGVQVQCAECHDHPYEPAWTQKQFQGVAAFFAPIEVQADFYTQPIDPRIEIKDVPLAEHLETYLKTLKEDIPAEYRGRVEDLLKYNVPQLPGDTALKTRDPKVWRRIYADWLLSAKHPTTARYLVNRHWSFLFGIGLLNPVDDFNSLNEASHPALLDALAADFVAHGFDVKRLYRAILNTRVYQLSSAGGPAKAELWHFASAPVRQLSPEQMFGALFSLEDGDAYLKSFARQYPSAYHRLKQFAAIREMQKKNGQEPEGNVNFNMELLHIYTDRLDAMRLKWRLRRALSAQYNAMAQNDEMTMSEGFSLSIDQALLVLNGDVTRRLSGSTNGSLVYAVMRDIKETPARVNAMYLSILSRAPDAAEAARAAAHIKACVDAGETEQSAYEDLFYALISTTEFATNH
ncbi:MAG: DUF1553 domain-containing protein [Planctomycetes bacterium]|nr:DUF1553 domain-containing protein [Planctomycetota bacterium]